MVKRTRFNIVLVEPEIPQNTGNIARTCAATGAVLHLVKPLGFSVENRYLKRAGLDYWEDMDIYYYDNFNVILEKYKENDFYFASTKAIKGYHEIEYKNDSFFVFGKETKGLPETMLRENYNHCIRIPMVNDIRSLNLSNSVAIIIYEAYRQNGFPNFTKQGVLKGI